MSLIKEKDNGTNIIRYYYLETVHSNMAAVEWISSLRNVCGIVVESFCFSDLLNRSDEGSGNLQLDAQVTTDNMKIEFNKRDVDLISLNGRFNDKPVVIGIDLRTNMVYLAIRKKIPANVELLENILQLI